jgi:hypothetical protein
MAKRCSDLADRVLWEGEGAISIRRLTTDDRTPSTIGDSSVNGVDDEWSVAYIREASFRKLHSATQRGWVNRFRRHRIVEPRTHPRSARNNKEAERQQGNGGQKSQQQQPESTANTASTKEPTSPSECMVSTPAISVHHSIRTTRDNVDGTRLLVKQNAKVFNRSSAAEDCLSIASSCDETIAYSVSHALKKARLVRRVSSITVGSRESSLKADWGDPLMAPLQTREEESDEDSILSVTSEPSFYEMYPDTGSPNSLPPTPFKIYSPSTRELRIESIVPLKEESVDEAILRISSEPLIEQNISSASRTIEVECYAPRPELRRANASSRNVSARIPSQKEVNTSDCFRRRVATISGTSHIAMRATAERSVTWRPSRRPYEPPSRRTHEDDDEQPAPLGAPTR